MYPRPFWKTHKPIRDGADPTPTTTTSQMSRLCWLTALPPRAFAPHEIETVDGTLARSGQSRLFLAEPRAMSAASSRRRCLAGSDHGFDEGHAADAVLDLRVIERECIVLRDSSDRARTVLGEVLVDVREGFEVALGMRGRRAAGGERRLCRGSRWRCDRPASADRATSRASCSAPSGAIRGRPFRHRRGC